MEIAALAMWWFWVILWIWFTCTTDLSPPMPTCVFGLMVQRRLIAPQCSNHCLLSSCLSFCVLISWCVNDMRVVCWSVDVWTTCVLCVDQLMCERHACCVLISWCVNGMCVVCWSVDVWTACVLCVGLLMCERHVCCVLVSWCVNGMCVVCWSVDVWMACVLCVDQLMCEWHVCCVLISRCVNDMCVVCWSVDVWFTCVLCVSQLMCEWHACCTFASRRPHVRTWGRQTCFLPRAPSNLVVPLQCFTFAMLQTNVSSSGWT